MFRILIAAVALLVVAGGAAFWAYGRSDDGAEAQTQLIRWVNVTVEVPENSGVWVTRDFWGIESTTPAMIISPFVRGEIEPGAVVSAETGAVLEDRVQPKHRAAIDEVLKTIKVSPLDRSAAPWPYSGQQPNVPREEAGKISYITPDPAAGITVTFQIGDGVADGEDTRPGSNVSIHVTNGRSWFGINAATGEVYQETAHILPEDKEAFDRFLSAVRHVSP
jgi:hypothetical protein